MRPCATGETFARVGLFEIKIEIPAATASAADDVLLEAGRPNWSVLEDVVAKRAWVVGIAADETTARREWRELEPTLIAASARPLAVPVVRALADVDWRDSYKAHFHAWQFGRLHWVPVWERATFTLPPGDAVLWLDPGLAFGTGNHETTRLCVERLVACATQFGVSRFEFGVEESGTQNPKPKTQNRAAGPRLVDAGCGSGILALSAALLGFGEILAFDNDPEAVRVSEENAALNGLTGRVRFFVGDLVSGLAPERERVDVVLANIQADVLMRFARELVGAVRPGGVLILSGILASENAQVREKFEAEAPGWTLNARTMGEWSDVVLTRPM